MQRRSLLLLLALPAGATARALAAPASPPLLAGTPICRGGLRPAAAAAGPDVAARDADYLEKLGLLEGHLLIGRRLLEAGQSRLAVPHFGHPIRELYTWLEPRLAARGAAGFEAELAAMEAWAEAGHTGTDGAFAAAWVGLRPRLAAAQSAIDPALRDNPRFMLEHVAMMVYDVASDYGESIERGRIVNTVEYHDSMGFLAYATAAATAQHGRGQATAEWAEVLAILEDMRRVAYPELLPAGRMPISISGLRSRSDQVRAIAARVPA